MMRTESFVFFQWVGLGLAVFGTIVAWNALPAMVQEADTNCTPWLQRMLLWFGGVALLVIGQTLLICGLAHLSFA